MTSDTSEKGLETIVVDGFAASGWVHTDTSGFDAGYTIDVGQLRLFLETTQPEVAELLGLGTDGPDRHKALSRIQGEVTKRGIVDVLRNGVDHGPAHIDLFYGTPSEGNTEARKRFGLNRFTVMRQLHFSATNPALSIDVVLLINGLPIVTFELKNSLTKQTVADAVEQYRQDRDPREGLFRPKRCLAHFAVDDSEAEFCTWLSGKSSWFLPFNQGFNHGAGNPPNPNGVKTAYLWERILTPESLTDIVENYAQVVTETDPNTGKKVEKLIFPRYHQLDAVRLLLDKAGADGPGRRYLVEHSAGSGKSNSIAWLAHQLIGLEEHRKPLFDTVIVATDRRVLDRQIRDTVKQFAQVAATVGHADRSSGLSEMIEEGKKIIITTVQKFPFVVAQIGDEHRDRSFAVLIDEAHSSQGGKITAAMSKVLGEHAPLGEDADLEDLINEAMASRKLPANASFFAFTATPKNKTLEIFGEAFDDSGVVKYRPTHVYSMKQAIEERFIIDVLKYYTPVESYYRLAKVIDTDPEFDKKKAQKKLRRYVEGHEQAIRAKVEIMVDHFAEQVLRPRKVGGHARAMIVTSGVQRAIDYFEAFNAYVAEAGYDFKAIVAFSEERTYGGKTVSEASLNGFASSKIPKMIRTDPYRFLIVADKFQTGYDEPLLHTMYVDKPLSGVKAVQTLSRLNRPHPKKHDAFVLDFFNDTETIRSSFQPYYQTTILSEATDPNKLHDLKRSLDDAQVYDQDTIDKFVGLYLSGASRVKLDTLLDHAVLTYTQLGEDEQVEFKSNAKAFVRTYNFLATALPFSNPGWEKLAIWLTFLIAKLPAPAEEDFAKGILNSIDMDSYRIEKQATVSLSLAEEDAEVGPVPLAGGGGAPEPEMERLSVILQQFNDLFGSIDWKDADRIKKLISEDLPESVAADPAYINAQQNSDKQNARIEHDKALARAMAKVVADDGQLFKQFNDNPDFRNWISKVIFQLTYQAKTA